MDEAVYYVHGNTYSIRLISLSARPLFFSLLSLPYNLDRRVLRYMSLYRYKACRSRQYDIIRKCTDITIDQSLSFYQFSTPLLVKKISFFRTGISDPG